MFQNLSFEHADETKSVVTLLVGIVSKHKANKRSYIIYIHIKSNNLPEISSSPAFGFSTYSSSSFSRYYKNWNFSMIEQMYTYISPCLLCAKQM